MFLATLLTQALLALSITGSPVEVRNSPITIPLTRRLNFSNGTINLLQHDESRVAAFRNYNAHDRGADIPVTCCYYGYTIAVGIGSPPTTYNLLLDSGSSLTWIKNEAYVQTPTSVDTGRAVKARYDEMDDGDDDYDDDDDKPHFKGTIWNDTVTLGGGLTVTEFPIGIAETVEGFYPDEFGILGIGPEILSFDTLINEPDETIPTITDYLYNQGEIDEHIIGIFLQPITTESDSLSGEVTFGGTDDTKCNSDVVYTPITTEFPASVYWGINQRITYGSKEILGTSAGIVDTGTVMLYIASDGFDRYKAATGGTHDEATRLLSITVDQYNALQSLDFHIEGKIFSLTANAQIWPRSLNDKIGGNPNGIYLIVKKSGSYSGRGDDFIVGFTFLSRFYTVFDHSDSRVGFATTSFTDATTN
ncbi:hypothetical protein BDR07DRAFT_1489523 [Suillus spraguei]|nr:hypothetical protein BDR07DRAFT_1489523 [Suillus spraguei]